MVAHDPARYAGLTRQELERQLGAPGLDRHERQSAEDELARRMTVELLDEAGIEQSALTAPPAAPAAPPPPAPGPPAQPGDQAIKRLEERLHRPDLDPAERRRVEEELTRRMTSDLLGGSQPPEPTPPPAPAPAWAPSADRPVDAPQAVGASQGVTSRQPRPQQAGGPGQRIPPPPTWPRQPPTPAAVPPPESSGRPARTRRGRRLPLLALVIVLLAAGAAAAVYFPRTGRSSDWVSTANAHCRQVVDPAMKRAGQLTTPADIPQVLPTLVSIQRDLDDYLRSLIVPAADESAVRQMTDYWDALTGQWRLAIGAYDSGDETAARTAVETGSGYNDKGNQIANQLGLGDCARAGGL